jgi:hypothetical protein
MHPLPLGGDVRPHDGRTAEQPPEIAGGASIIESSRSSKGDPPMWEFAVEFVLCPLIALFVYWLIWGRGGGDDDGRR